MEFNTNLNNLFTNYQNQQKYAKKAYDVNGDGKVNSNDKTALTNDEKNLKKTENLFDVNGDGVFNQTDIDMFVRGDVNGDGTVTQEELDFISKYKGDMQKAFVSAKADFELDGKKYVNGKLATGIYDNKYYKNGVLATGTYDKKYYVNGALANGTYSNVLYKNGEKFTGIYTDRLYYKDGKVGTGVYENKYYKNGVLSTGTNNGKYYVNGVLANGTYSNILYKNGDKFTGIHTDKKYYKNGVLATGTYDKKYYVNGSLANGMYNKVLYKNGDKFTGLYTDKKYYKDGKLFTGTVDGAKYKDGVLQYSIGDNNGTGYPNASGDSVKFKNGSKYVTVQLTVGEKATINEDNTVQIVSKDGKTVKLYASTGTLKEIRTYTNANQKTLSSLETYEASGASRRTTYKSDGKTISSVENKDANGKLVSKEEYVTSNNKEYKTVTEYKSDGSVSSEILYENGVAFEGTYKNKFYVAGHKFTGTTQSGETYKDGDFQYSVTDNKKSGYPQSSGNTIVFQGGYSLTLNVGDRATINADGTVSITAKDGTVKNVSVTSNGVTMVEMKNNKVQQETIHYSNGNTRVTNYTTVNGQSKISSVNETNAAGKNIYKETYNYDKNGNETQKVVNEYKYDDAGREIYSKNVVYENGILVHETESIKSYKFGVNGNIQSVTTTDTKITDYKKSPAETTLKCEEYTVYKPDGTGYSPTKTTVIFNNPDGSASKSVRESWWVHMWGMFGGQTTTTSWNEYGQVVSCVNKWQTLSGYDTTYPQTSELPPQLLWNNMTAKQLSTL